MPAYPPDPLGSSGGGHSSRRLESFYAEDSDDDMFGTAPEAEGDVESDEWFQSRMGGSMKPGKGGRRKNHEFWNSQAGFYEEVPTHLQKGKYMKARYFKQFEVSEEEQHEWFQSRKGGPKKQGKGTHNRKRHLYWNSHTGENDPIPEELQVGKFASIVRVAKPEPEPEEQHEWFQSRKGGPKKPGRGNKGKHLYWNSHTGEHDPIPEELQVGKFAPAVRVTKPAFSHPRSNDPRVVQDPRYDRWAESLKGGDKEYAGVEGRKCEYSLWSTHEGQWVMPPDFSDEEESGDDEEEERAGERGDEEDAMADNMADAMADNMADNMAA